MKKTKFPLSLPLFLPLSLAIVLVLGISTYVSAVTINDVVRVTPEEVLADMEAGHKILIVDLRSKGAYEAMDIRIEGDFRIPPDDLEARMYELPMGTEIVTYCTWPSEASSAGAALYLMRGGFRRVKAMKGGIDAWVRAGGPVVKK